MYSIFSSIRKENFSQKVFSMFVAFAFLLPVVSTLPFVAQADVTVHASDTTGTSHYTVATSTDNIVISYTVPSGYPTTTPTLDALASILASINTALASAKASTTCSGLGTATANAQASAMMLVNGSSVSATATASASVDCTPPPPPTPNTRPVITVLPPNPMMLTLGDVFSDPGATAFDMEDGTITPSIITTGSVNTSATGTYTIFYNVTDSKGLAAAQKTRTVNVVEPDICVAPLDVMLVIDRSGSMSDHNNPQLPLTKAKTAATTFVNTLSTATDHVGVVSYNENATLDHALTSNFAAAKSSIASITAGGATNIGDAFKKAAFEMTTNGRSEAKHVIVLLSDGLPNRPNNVATGTAYALSQATIAKTKGYVIYTIGLGGDVNPVLMKQLATTPDNYYFAPTTDDLDAIYRAISATECERIPGVISGKKWNDKDGNGIIDGNDVGIPDWQITLTSVGDNNATSRFEETNINGEFTFSDVFPGTYLLCEVGKNGWTETAPSTTTDNGCYRIEVTNGQHVFGKNFLNTETVKPHCSDGVDNDNDCTIDYPEDTGCDSPNDNDENNPPVITVLGDDPFTLTVGTTFTDPGATAFDSEDKDITASIIKTGTVNTASVGTYTITYNVKDSKGLAAPSKTRTVIVTSQCSDGKDNDGDAKVDMADTGCENPNDNDENNRPVITVLGSNPFELTLGDIFTDPGATAFDMEDGTITPNIVKTGTVNTNATGTYTIFYNVTDSKGLAAVEKTRTVLVNPVLTQCSDEKDNDGDGKVDYPLDTGCDSTDDNDENNRPVITVLGDNPLSVHIGTTFTDPGATAFDMEDGTITPVTASGTVNMLNVGAYTIFYNVKDSDGLAAVEKTRVVNVASSCSDGRDNDGDTKIDYPADTGCTNPNDDSENQAPTLTLLGNTIMSLVVGTTFTDPGATATDHEDGDITASIIKTGTVNVATLGTYFLAYNVKDSQGLAAETATRTVNVIPAGCTENCGGGGGGSDNNRPIITLIGANPFTVTQGTSFIDPGATALDLEDGDVTANIIVGGVADTSKLGNYELTYDVSDSQGLPAARVTRTVTVTSGGGGGGGEIMLSIFNEKIATTSPTTVVISWNTNQPSDSRVVYGLDSHATLGAVPLYGYQLTTATDTALVTSHSVAITDIPSAITTYFRPVSSDGVRIATGIELAHIPAISAPAACFYLKEYMRLGANNNPEEVTKLQTFLRDYEGFANLRVTGIFDITTDQAVRNFQDKYTADVLTPWNLPGNTGYVYYTTQKKINEIYCQHEFPLTATQVAEIAAFRELINKINTQGAGALPTLPLVGVAPTTGEVSGGETDGVIAGVSTETEGAIASGVGTTSKEKAPESRGRIALADLLAAMPTIVDIFKGGEGRDTDALSTSTFKHALGTTMGTSTIKRNFAAVVQSISARTKLSTGGVYALLVFILAFLVLSVLISRRYRSFEKKTDDDLPKKNVDNNSSGKKIDNDLYEKKSDNDPSKKKTVNDMKK